MPFGADNALVKAAEVVRRIADVPAGGRDQRRVARLRRLARPRRRDPRRPRRPGARAGTACESIADARTAKFAHACTHTTFSPDVVHGGMKTNVIPDEVDDRRRHPHPARADRRRRRRACWPTPSARSPPHVTVELLHERPSTQSPMRHAAVGRHRRASWPRCSPEATLLPRITAGGTDATFFRDAGSVGLRLRAAVAAPSPTRTSRPRSTATTSASTWSRSGSRRSAG